jgi:hypothetical protein
MNHPEKMHSCLHCNCRIDEKVQKSSIASFGFQLCFNCQHSLKIDDKNNAEAIKLYLSLKKRAVPAELEKSDGHKTMDIAVADARVNIEVDGTQHNSNYNQAFSDLKQNCYSFQPGYFTLRIPTSLIREYLEDTADYVTEFLRLNKSKILKAS